MNKIIIEFKKLDTSILHYMKNGIKYSFMISILSGFILLAYEAFYTSPTFYHIGISLFRTSLFFMVSFIIGAFAFNKMKQELQN